MLCGAHRIVLAGRTLKEIESAVERRIQSLKELYDVPSCRHLLTVDRHGAVTTGRLPVAQW